MSIPFDLPAAGDPLALRLLRDELSIDADVATPAAATRMLPRLVALVVGGFAAQAACTGLLWLAFTAAGPADAATLTARAAWAMTVGFFVAISAGQPGYWFHAVVLRVNPPPWRIALELVRVQAVASVALFAVLPLWVAACLGLWLVGGDLPDGWILAGNALPWLSGVPGMLGLRRAFSRMATVRGVRNPGGVGVVLTGWWAIAFSVTAPITVLRLMS